MKNQAQICLLFFFGFLLLGSAGFLPGAVASIDAQENSRPAATTAAPKTTTAAEVAGQAKAFLEENVKLDPANAERWFTLGMFNGENGDYQEAAAAFEQAIRLQPEMVEVHLELGVAYHELKRYDEAIKAFRRETEINPGNDVPYYNLGLTFAKLHQWNKAAAAFAEAIRRNPEDPTVFYLLGSAYLEDGDREAAMAQYKLLQSLDRDLAAKLFDRIFNLK